MIRPANSAQRMSHPRTNAEVRRRPSPPPADFDGEEGEGCFGYGYARTLSPAELAVIEAEVATDRAREVARRDRYFGFEGGELSSPRGYEPNRLYEPSEPSDLPLRRCEERSDEAIQSGSGSGLLLLRSQ